MKSKNLFSFIDEFRPGERTVWGSSFKNPLMGHCTIIENINYSEQLLSVLERTTVGFKEHYLLLGSCYRVHTSDCALSLALVLDLPGRCKVGLWQALEWGGVNGVQNVSILPVEKEETTPWRGIQPKKDFVDTFRRWTPPTVRCNSRRG